MFALTLRALEVRPAVLLVVARGDLRWRPPEATGGEVTQLAFVVWARAAAVVFRVELRSLLRPFCR